MGDGRRIERGVAVCGYGDGGTWVDLELGL